MESFPKGERVKVTADKTQVCRGDSEDQMTLGPAGLTASLGWRLIYSFTLGHKPESSGFFKQRKEHASIPRHNS